jgi:antitoxin component HigA of HigAB toxin-antitoxin module
MKRWLGIFRSNKDASYDEKKEMLFVNQELLKRLDVAHARIKELEGREPEDVRVMERCMKAMAQQNEEMMAVIGCKREEMNRTNEVLTSQLKYKVDAYKQLEHENDILRQVLHREGYTDEDIEKEIFFGGDQWSEKEIEMLRSMKKLNINIIKDVADILQVVPGKILYSGHKEPEDI